MIQFFPKIGNLESLSADVVVIGGGGAGLSAAVAAAEMGAKVIVLEKSGVPGGNTALASGLFAAESPTQKRAMIEAPRDELFKTLMDWHHWKINPRIMRAIIDRSGDTIGWLEERGCVFNVIPFYPNQTPRVWHIPQRRAVVTDSLIESCVELGVKIIVRCEAKRILKAKDGRMAGVVFSSRDRDFTIGAPSVVISTGGYGGNTELHQGTLRILPRKHGLPGPSHRRRRVAACHGSGCGHRGAGQAPDRGPLYAQIRPHHGRCRRLRTDRTSPDPRRRRTLRSLGEQQRRTLHRRDLEP